MKKACIAAGLFKMAHSRGFEPLTARFVAGYSIQLSYECTGYFYTRPLWFDKPHGCNLFDMAHSRGFEPLTARFVAGYSIQLSYECAERAHYRYFNLSVK